MQYLGACPSFISVAVLKYPNKGQSEGEMVYVSSQFQVTVCGCREATAVGAWDTWSHHIYSQEWRDVYVCMLTCLCSAQLPCLGNGATRAGPGFLTSVTLIVTLPHSQAHKPPLCRQPLIEILLPGDSKLNRDDREAHYRTPDQVHLIRKFHFHTQSPI